MAHRWLPCTRCNTTSGIAASVTWFEGRHAYTGYFCPSCALSVRAALTGLHVPLFVLRPVDDDVDVAEHSPLCACVDCVPASTRKELAS